MEEVIDCILCIKAHYQVLETVTSSATEDCLPLHNSRVVGHPNPARKPIAQTCLYIKVTDQNFVIQLGDAIHPKPVCNLPGLFGEALKTNKKKKHHRKFRVRGTSEGHEVQTSAQTRVNQKSSVFPQAITIPGKFWQCCTDFPCIVSNFTCTFFRQSQKMFLDLYKH